MDYQSRPEDLQFILFDVLQADQALAGLADFADADRALMAQVLDEAGKFIAAEIAPLNRTGDEIGCQFASGQVTTPPGFRAAYQSFWQGGWASLSCATEDGGQGLPEVLNQVLYEMLSASNHGWTMAPGLLHGAYECLKHHGSDSLRGQYLEKIATGEWLATMCLTEPHAGSDLGLVRTRAVPQADGSYQVNGTKIFISGGEHDLTDNIVHLVLARLPDAPPGPKGLSLFLVPKIGPDERRNAVFCERIEEKMGLHGSATCVMRFDDAQGWLVGEPGRGLNAMFVMMNAARLHVALQGIGLLDAAWQKADAYAQERRQMRAPGKDARRTAGPPQGASAPSGLSPAAPDLPTQVGTGRSGTASGAAQSSAVHTVTSVGASNQADLIMAHPAVRRILDTQRAWVDGMRVLAYQTGLELDLARKHPDAARREQAQRWCSLVTPVLKSACTEQAFHGGSDCLQVFGGHGYVREWGIEQIVRDSRVAMIYEGTNEIQAIDLLVRKVLPDGGQALSTLLDELAQQLDPHKPADADVLAQFGALRDITRQLLAAAGTSTEAPYWVAGDYLRAVALALLAWAWRRIEAVPASSAPRWQAPARALRAWVMPEWDMRLQTIRAHCLGLTANAQTAQA